jgi:beta-N-acetylhexosaminidase
VTTLTNDFQSTITDAGGLPLLIAIDQEGGVVARLTDGFSVFPSPLVTTASGEDMAYQMGQAVAQELSAVGINMNLAPVADLETNEDNPIIRRRSYGSHPEVVGRTIVQVVRGTQSMNVLATVKHFPGHGETGADSHAILQQLDISRERIEALELEPFRQAIDDGDVAAVMVAHIWFPALDSVRRPATLSSEVVTGVLRDELGYDGLIVTDAMDMNAVDMEVYFSESMVEAVEAGVDLMTLGPSFGIDIADESIQAVIDAVRSGRIPESRIDESVRRILAAKARYGILDWQPLDPATAAERVNLEGHAALMDELFRRAVTVAYDHGDHIPLRSDTNIAIVFLATRYQIRDECAQYNPNIRWVGVSDNPSGDEIGWAAGAAEWSDTTVVFTQDAITNPEQQALVNALPPEKTVAVALWSPYDWHTYPRVAAYVATYSPLRPAVPAACAVLFGAIPANGQLPVTLALDLQAGTRGQ